MCPLSPIERPRFWHGKLLTAEDLSLEQEYFREKHRRHNRHLHGFGIVNGLKVSVDAGQIRIEEGLALDCEGNEIVVEGCQSVPPPRPEIVWPVAYLELRYSEEAVEPVPSPSGLEMSKIRELAELSIVEQNCIRGHRHLGARWLACGQPHGLPIARVKYFRQGWRVDLRYRAPGIK